MQRERTNTEVEAAFAGELEGSCFPAELKEKPIIIPEIAKERERILRRVWLESLKLQRYDGFSWHGQEIFK